MLGIRTLDPNPPEQVGLVRARIHVACAVEHLTDLNAAMEQLSAGGFDVGDDQVKALRGAGRCSGDVSSEDDGTPGTGGRELNHAKVAAVVVVGVQSPSEVCVERLRAVDIGDWDDDDLELHVGSR